MDCEHDGKTTSGCSRGIAPVSKPVEGEQNGGNFAHCCRESVNDSKKWVNNIDSCV
jgi:hypothetical protein